MACDEDLGSLLLILVKLDALTSIDNCSGLTMSRITQLPISKEVIENRLITRETCIGGASANKMATRVVLLLESLSLGDEAKEKAYNELLKDFRTMALEMEKVKLMHEQLPLERQAFEATSQRIDTQMQETESEIEELKTQLEVEKEIYRQKQEYEALAKKIIEYPSQDYSKERIAKVNAEIDEMQRQKAVLQAQVAMRTRQLNLLIHGCIDLKKSLDYDRVADEEVQAYLAAQGGMEAVNEDDAMQDGADKDEEEMQY